jgi:DNA polymerase
MCFGNVPDTLSQLVRTAFVAGKGKTFAVPDFSAIEARVIAWFADEQWRMDIFSTHGKIYEASAAKMFNVPIEEVTKGSDLRSKGKVAELALGYQGGVGALINMGALSMGIPESDLQGIVTAWRRASPKIASLWDNVNAAAISAIEGQPVTMTRIGMRFFMDHKSLMIELPSGRRLCYHGARLKPGRFGNNEIVYWGMNQTTKQWCEETTYGGKLVENIVQAIARDCLAYSMLRLDDLGYEMVMHVHDEIVMQIPDSDDAANELKKIEGIMGMQIPWAKGLDLKAAGSLTHYYKKDD